MKKFFLQFTAFSAFALTSTAQISVGAQASYLTGHGATDNHSTLVGATVFGTYAITDNMSLGTVIHAYGPKKSNYKSGDFAYKATDDVTNVSVSYELALASKSSLIQPYMGVDVGLSTSNHNVEYYNDLNKLSKLKIKQSYVMMSPKVGMTISLSKTFGIYTQAQYNFSPGNGGPVVIDVKNSKSGVTTFTTEPISKYYNIDTGVYLLLGKIKTILN